MIGLLFGLLQITSHVAAEPDGVARVAIPLRPRINDPKFASQWAHHNRGQAKAYGGGRCGVVGCDIKTPKAWTIQQGIPMITLAIIDTGVDETHFDFSGRVVAGWDFVNGDALATDDHGHGTACAGIAAAEDSTAIKSFCSVVI